ncbi:adenosine kinase [Zavarzinia sp. CC-PAN008]|uniref:adenosine kinase n=1 Tax=Zavarzinia sp. CC-PAN008 TaxID=3243332 RepID=UPI003F74868D
MQQPRIDVLGIGNAIVDVLAAVDEDFLARTGLVKGSMTLITAEQAEALYAAMPPGRECSGGSAANTIAGVASLGGRAAYVGKVRNDQLGAVFSHDLKALGVGFSTPTAEGGPPTARCLVLVTPDGQRTMATYLGACVALGPEDIDAETVAAASITYLEGYLWDPPLAKDAFRKAMAIAHQAGRLVGLSLSDSFCVDRYRDEFLALVRDDVDILFANESELCSLFQVDNFDAALQRARGVCRVAALTRSEKGSVVLAGDEVHVIDAERIDRVVDATGAGDLYAAGFLYGLTQRCDLATCGRLGAMAAAEVIGHLGARPEVSLASLRASRVGVA